MWPLSWKSGKSQESEEELKEGKVKEFKQLSKSKSLTILQFQSDSLSSTKMLYQEVREISLRSGKVNEDEIREKVVTLLNLNKFF